MTAHPSSGGIGQSVRRREDLRLLTGGGRYSDDAQPARPGLRGDAALAARACADPRDRHRRGARDARRARGADRRRTCWPTGWSRFRTRSGPTIRPNLACPTPDGSPAYIPPHFCMATDEVRHVGEIVAMVVANDASPPRRTPPSASPWTTSPLPAVTHALDRRRAGRAARARRRAVQCLRRCPGRRRRRHRGGLRPRRACRAARHLGAARRRRADGAARRDRRLRPGDRALHAARRRRRRGAATQRPRRRAGRRRDRRAHGDARRRRQFRHARRLQPGIRPGALGRATGSAAR